MRSGCNQDISQPSIRNPSSFAVVMSVVERGRASGVYLVEGGGVDGSRAEGRRQRLLIALLCVRRGARTRLSRTQWRILIDSVAGWLSVGIHRLGIATRPMADS